MADKSRDFLNGIQRGTQAFLGRKIKKIQAKVDQAIDKVIGRGTT